MLKKVLKIVGRVLLVVLVTVVILAGTVYIMLQKCCNGPSESARNLFVTTILETGQMKFLASWVCSDEEIQAIVNSNSMEAFDKEVDTDKIVIPPSGTQTEEEGFDENGIKIVEISGRTFFAKLMIIKDPSQVKVGTTYPWTEYGENLDVIVSNSGAVAGVNGGLYQSSGNKGGRPLGYVVSNGEVQYNGPYDCVGMYLIGLNKDNILIIKSMEGMTQDSFKAYVQSEGIRDAVAFQEESSDSNNHFVPLIINGEARQLNGMGSGANPRTAIGQRADGAILLLVTDGRGASGHLGATAADLIGIMQEYGAVNAANIDGGSSSTMVYNGAYEMTSVTFYYANSSWRLPTAFVVMPKEK
ncbi:MAG: phosphodiester glycosidase family protein [Lachnospiraceae bacterium]|nr:phosphodiester glycosidase family protein [Lachnospiraceae bacterium]MBR6697791.1 phosphodiester glycosidase family protein [Lachnospiraceae bacterium]